MRFYQLKFTSARIFICFFVHVIVHSVQIRYELWHGVFDLKKKMCSHSQDLCVFSEFTNFKVCGIVIDIASDVSIFSKNVAASSRWVLGSAMSLLNGLQEQTALNLESFYLSTTKAVYYIHHFPLKNKQFSTSYNSCVWSFYFFFFP